MYKFDRIKKTKQLPREIRKQLINKLNAGDAWKTFASFYSKAYEFSDLMPKLTEETVKKPSQTLLLELDKHNIDVEIMCIFLKECKLYDALLVLQNPEKLTIKVHPIDENKSTIESIIGVVNLKCEASGIPPPQYQWFHNDKFMNETTCEILIDLQSNVQEGEYVCRVYQEDEKGEVFYEEYSRKVSVKLIETPVKINLEIKDFLELKDGETFTLQCRAISHPPPVFQWYKDDIKIPKETSDTLTASKYSPSKEGSYYCKVSNSFSKETTQTSTVTTYAPRVKATFKVALLIGNQHYKEQRILPTVRVETDFMARVLKQLKFHVICLTDLSLEQMKNAIDKFCEFLIKGAYGILYFCGHGIQLFHKYLMPVETPIMYKQSDMMSEAYILSKLLAKDAELLVVVLDMCLITPTKEEGPLLHKELPELLINSGKRNLVLAYSTSSHCKTFEPKQDQHSYTLHLCRYMLQGIPVNRVVELAARAFQKYCTGVRREKQIPSWWSNTTKSFRFTDTVSYGSEESQKCKETLERLTSIESPIIMVSEKANTSFYVEISTVDRFLNCVLLKVINLDSKYTPHILQYPDDTNSETFVVAKTESPYEVTVECPRRVPGYIIISLCDSNGPNQGACSLHLEEVIPFLKILYK